MKTDLIGIIEATYRIELDTDTWLKGILSAASLIISRGMGLVAYTYDASDPADLRVGSFIHEGLPDQAVPEFLATLSRMDPAYVRNSYCSLTCATGSEVPGYRELPFVERFAREFRVRDILMVNGVSPDGQGCLFGALLPQETKLTAPRRTLLAKLACHLAAAHRLRQRLASIDSRASAAEAVVDYSGEVHHAEGEARSKAAQSRLKQSALAIASARGDLRTLQPERAIDEWKGLIAARWTLIDVCERDGRRYLVARQNKPRVRGPSVLTDREQEVLAFAVLGHHNKLIAYNLGISPSTVRVLIARAAGKLGAGSRAELIRQGKNMTALR
jgi:DNA-binding CsgD family transcriptional regulator